MNLPHFERFLKCNKCLKKIRQAGTLKVAHCTTCGMIRTNNCVDALSATTEVIDDTGKRLVLKLNCSGKTCYHWMRILLMRSCCLSKPLKSNNYDAKSAKQKAYKENIAILFDVVFEALKNQLTLIL